MAEKRFNRVKTPSERDQRELAGLWQAIGFVRECAERKERITIAVILEIHRVFLGEVIPEAAGRFRRDGEDVRKLKCTEPPPGRLVVQRMQTFWRDFDTRSALVPLKPPSSKTGQEKWFKAVLNIAVWVQHQLAVIHPFVEGNGRMARLMTNLILERYGIKPSQVRYEGEMKEKYLDSLCQADRVGDYEPLRKIVLQGIREVYEKEKKLRQRKAT